MPRWTPKDDGATWSVTLHGPAVNDRPVFAVVPFGYAHGPARTSQDIATMLAEVLTRAAELPHRPYVVGEPGPIVCGLCGKAVRGGGPSYPDPLPYIHAEV